jgi:hypothetical protein
MSKGPYTKPGRLSDVLALIQVLAIDEHSHRSEPGIKRELQGNPSSSDSWITLAKEHPEFFRVTLEGEHLLALIARHVMPKNPVGVQEVPYELTYRLLATAIDLHDRQVKAAEKWTNYVPLWAALIGGIFGTVSVLVTLWFKGYPK